MFGFELFRISFFFAKTLRTHEIIKEIFVLTLEMFNSRKSEIDLFYILNGEELILLIPVARIAPSFCIRFYDFLFKLS